MARRRRMTRAERRVWSAGVVVAGLAWAWQTHPVLLVAGLTLAATAAGLGLWARRAWLQRAGRPTVLYRHYTAGGRPLYYGISSHYGLRCAQHAEGSWWWPLVDPARSTCQTWPNRQAAERAERTAIHADCPIGNQEHNPRYWTQEPERRELRAAAARAAYEDRLTMIGDV
jgi:hypothetical protein